MVKKFLIKPQEYGATLQRMGQRAAFLFLISIALSQNSCQKVWQPKAKAGHLAWEMKEPLKKERATNSEVQGISLDGEWLFIPKEFVYFPKRNSVSKKTKNHANLHGLKGTNATNAQNTRSRKNNQAYFSIDLPSKNYIYLEVPGAWNGVSTPLGKMSAHSYGTYYLHLKIPQEFVGTPLLVKFGQSGSAYEFFINGRKVGGRGKIGRNADEEVPNTNSATYVFTPQRTDLHVFIRISNFNYWKGGLWNGLSFETINQVSLLLNKGLSFDFILIPVLFIMGLYYIIFLFIRKADLAPGYFGLLCLMFMIRQLSIGDKLLFQYFPSVPWAWQIRTEYWSLIFSVIAFSVYYRMLAPSRWNARLSKGTILLGIPLGLLVLATPPVVFTQYVKFVMLYAFLYAALALAIAGYNCIKNTESARVLFVGGSILTAGVVSDILRTAEIIQIPSLVSLAWLIFIFINAVLLIQRVLGSLAREETLRQKLARNVAVTRRINNELTELQATLVEKIQDRTRELKNALQLAEASARAKSDFLANMSHEIRTPLNAILGFTTLLEQELDSEEHKVRLRSIQRNSSHLLNIVNEILDYSKIESGQVELHWKETPLRSFIEEIVSSIQPQAEARGNRLSIEIDPALPDAIPIDAFHLKKILINLLSNATKFTTDGEISLRVQKESGSPKGLPKDSRLRIRFAVQDTGIGIAEEAQEKILGRFTQEDFGTTREYGGTGLGLAITSGLLKAMGSHLELTSKKGEGSTFSFVLKIPKNAQENIQTVIADKSADKSSTENEAPANKKEKIRDMKKMPNFRVLLVEDNMDNELIATSFMKKWDVEVATAHNGKEALGILAKEEFDLVLMDLQMPVMDGYTATREIRKRNIATPVVALTAAVAEEVTRKAKEAGMDDYFPKPFLPKALHELLYSYWHKKQESGNQGAP